MTTETEFFPDETVLPDDYPIYGDYFYLADGKVYRSDYHAILAGELKRRLGVAELRRCNWRWTVDWRGCQCKYHWQYRYPTDGQLG